MSTASVAAIIAAQEIRLQKEIYSIVVNGVRDIDRISAMKKLSPRVTLRHLEKIIRKANTYKKKKQCYWSAFAVAYIDKVENQIVITASTKELIVITADYDKTTITIYSTLGWVLLVSGLLLAPFTFGITLILLGGGAIVFFVLVHYAEKINKRFNTYYDLLHTKKVTTIQGIALATQQSSVSVKSEIQDLINKMVFINAKIDTQTGDVIIGELFNL